MALSNIPAVKRALFDALKVYAFEDPQPGIWYSTPNVDHDFHDNVIVGPADVPARSSQEWATMGAGGQRDERIDVPVRVEVFREGTDEFDAEARAWDLAAAVAGVLAERPFDPMVYESHPDDFEQATTPATADEVVGRMATVNLVVRCSSRISGI